jgi:hypothetical protein
MDRLALGCVDECKKHYIDEHNKVFSQLPFLQ